MPPVMGAAAFVMADYIAVPYATVCLRAALPAVMYYFILGLIIHLYASRKGLYGAPKEEIPRLREVLRKQGLLLLPLFAIVVGFVSPESFGLTELLVELVIIVVGGLGSITGSIMGCILLVAIPEILRQFRG